MELDVQKESCCSTSPKSATAAMSEMVHRYYSGVAAGKGPYAADTRKFSPSGPTERIVQYAKELGKTRILDLGSGMGTTLLRLAREHDGAKQLIGVDFSEEMVKRAREESQNLPPELRKKVGFLVEDLQSLPFLDGQFDLIYSECVFNLVPDRERAIREVSRLLEKDGIFVYTDFVAFSPVTEEIRNNEELVCGCRSGSVSLSENVRLLEANGFKHIQCLDYTADKNKRDQALRSSSPQIDEEFRALENDPEVATFLNQELGYYLISGIKR